MTKSGGNFEMETSIWHWVLVRISSTEIDMRTDLDSGNNTLCLPQKLTNLIMSLL